MVRAIRNMRRKKAIEVDNVPVVDVDGAEIMVGDRTTTRQNMI